MASDEEEAAKRHEEHAQAIVAEIDSLLIDALKLSREDHLGIFRHRDEIFRSFRALLHENTYRARQSARAAIRDEIAKLLR